MTPIPLDMTISPEETSKIAEFATRDFR